MLGHVAILAPLRLSRFELLGRADGSRGQRCGADHEHAELSSDAKAVKDNPFRFQGHYYDSGVKTYDMQARQYLPQVGRFLGKTATRMPQLT